MSDFGAPRAGRLPSLAGMKAFSSGLRSPRLTSQLGLWLGGLFGVCFVTGFISHEIQHPASWFWWPARPVWLYRVTQGLHVATGLASIPLLGVKLWAVFPRLVNLPTVEWTAGAGLGSAGRAGQCARSDCRRPRAGRVRCAEHRAVVCGDGVLLHRVALLDRVDRDRCAARARRGEAAGGAAGVVGAGASAAEAADGADAARFARHRRRDLRRGDDRALWGRRCDRLPVSPCSAIAIRASGRKGCR